MEASCSGGPERVCDIIGRRVRLPLTSCSADRRRLGSQTMSARDAAENVLPDLSPDTRRAQSSVVYVGGFNPCSIAVIRGFAAAGFRVHVIEEMPSSEAAASSEGMLPGSVPFDESLLGTAEGLRRIVGVIAAADARAVVGQSDDFLLWMADNRAALPPACALLCPPREALARAQSKLHQIDAARRFGIDVLPTYLLRNPADARRIDAAHYPLVIRPSTRHSVQPRFRIHLAGNAAEAQEWLAGHVVQGDPVIGQPFRELPGLLVHGVNSLDGRCLEAATYLVARKFAGVSLSVRPVACDGPLVERVVAMSLGMGIVGPYHVELLYDPRSGQAWHLDLNARFGGTTDKVRRLGFDEPALTLRAFGLLGPAAEAGAPSPHGEVVNKDVVVTHMASAVRGRLSPLDYPRKPRWWHVMRDSISLLCSMDSLFYPGDVRGYLKSVVRFTVRRFL